MRRAAAARLILGSCLVAASAQAVGTVATAPDFPDACETYDAALESAPMMRVAPRGTQAQVHFEKRGKDCRDSGGCWQPEKNYLVKGDPVFVSKEKSGHRCAYFGTAKGSLLAGFLPVDSLVPLREETALDPKFLVGDWKNFDDDVRITAAAKGKVHAEGSAIWRGARDAHVGDFAADAGAGGPEVVFVDGDCQVHVRRRGEYLLLDDNENCGGANVRFMGIYVRNRAGSK